MAITRDLWIVLRARDEASRIIRSFGTNVAAASGIANSNMSAFERTMRNVAVTMNQFAMTSMLAGAAMAGAGAAGLSFIKSATDVAAEYDRQVRKTITQIDGITTNLEEVAEVGRRVAREVEIPFEQMQETLFFIFSSMSVNMQEAEKLLKGFAQEAVAGNTSVEAAARSNIAIMNALGLSVDDLSRIQDVQFQVVRKGVITYEELAEVIGRALPAAARSGQSIETLGAMIAFLTRNGLSAAMAATSAARAMESFAHPKTIARLEKMGVTVKDAKGEFLPLLQVMAQMNKKLGQLSAPERAKALQELFLGAGGTIQARRFWDTAFKNFGDFEQMVGFMANSTGVFQNAYETMADSVANQTVLLHNKWMLIKEALGRAVMPHLLELINLLQRVLTWFDNLPEPTKRMIAQFILWGSVMSIAIGILVILIGSLAFFVSGIMLAGTALIGIIAAIVTLTAGMIALSAAIYLAWQRSLSFRDALGEIGLGFMDLKDVISESAADARKAFDQHLRPALDNISNIINTKVLPAVKEFITMVRDEVIPKIQEASRIISDLFSTSMEHSAKTINEIIIPAIEKLSDWWDKNGDTLRPFIGYIGELVKWMLILGASLAIIAPIEGFMTSIAALTLGVFNFVVAIKTLWGWITTAGSAIGSFFSNLYTTVSTFISDVVNSIITFFKPAIDFFVQLFGLIGDLFKLFGVLITEIVKDWIIPLIGFIFKMWNDVYSFLLGLWNGIVKAIKDFFNRIFGEVKASDNPIVQTVISTWTKVRDFIKDAVNGVIEFFKNARTWLFNAGRDIVTGLLEGLTEKIKDLRKKLKEITDMIPEIKGPKSVDLKLLLPAGRNIMQGFMEGIESQVPMLMSQLQGITNQIGQIPSPTLTMPTPSFVSGSSTEPKQITQNITINTQEVNPRINAEELGFELGDRM